MKTNTNETGLEDLIVAHLRGVTDVLRRGFAFNGTTFDLYFPIPVRQIERTLFDSWRFHCVRQKLDTFLKD